MELFYTNGIDGNLCRLDEEESGHCVRVLRHRAGDEICVIDGKGGLYRCRIVGDRPKAVEAEILSCTENWNVHPYRLTMAVCPTKNIDRYEWFVEKATEIGVDRIVPVIGEHSERKIVKTQRLEKIVVSAAKQSLKAAVPEIADPLSVREFIAVPDGSAVGLPSSGDASSSRNAAGPLKLIACCFEDAEHPRRSIREVLECWLSENFPESLDGGRRVYDENNLFDVEGDGSSADEGGIPSSSAELQEGDPRAAVPKIIILIGPEGDFSEEEVRSALAAGYVPVHLGASRLRTETAALVSVEAVYNSLML